MKMTNNIDIIAQDNLEKVISFDGFFYGLASQTRKQRGWIVKTETAVQQPTKAVTP